MGKGKNIKVLGKDNFQRAVIESLTGLRVLLESQKSETLRLHKQLEGNISSLETKIIHVNTKLDDVFSDKARIHTQVEVLKNEILSLKATVRVNDGTHEKLWGELKAVSDTALENKTRLLMYSGGIAIFISFMGIVIPKLLHF